MNLHEYQSKQLFQRHGIPAGQGEVADSVEGAEQAARTLGGEKWVVKAQVHAGGRGKAGGVKLVEGIDDLRQAAEDMLGQKLVTKQTGEEGLPINQVYVEMPSEIDREIYLSVLVDRASERIVFMTSPDGGMDIEAVAENTPERILSASVHPATGIQGYHARRLAFFLGLSKEQIKPFARVLSGLYDIFLQCDASLVEINPLITTKGGDLMALDAKINIDDNALYRQQEIAEMRDITQEDAKEAEAAEHDLNYITLNGDIGCMVNGAGLAMATMDLIKLHGGDPANFLDVGGAATKERVAEAFKLILSGDHVKAILVNIFGGIVRCDLIAEGIIAAVEEVGVEIPVVARLEGTNVDKGRQLLEDCPFEITAATDLTDAARKVVDAANK